jgi:hypothetical protein
MASTSAASRLATFLELEQGVVAGSLGQHQRPVLDEVSQRLSSSWLMFWRALTVIGRFLYGLSGATPWFLQWTEGTAECKLCWSAQASTGTSTIETIEPCSRSAARRSRILTSANEERVDHIG